MVLHFPPIANLATFCILMAVNDSASKTPIHSRGCAPRPAATRSANTPVQGAAETRLGGLERRSGVCRRAVYSLTKVPLCIFFSIYSRNVVWPSVRTVLKMALFYSLRNRQVGGESQEEAASRPLAPSERPRLRWPPW